MSFAYMLVTIYGDDEEEAWANKGKIVDWMLQGEQKGSMPDDYSCESDATLSAMSKRVEDKQVDALIDASASYFMEEADNNDNV